ncbi:toll/interleukin-1 receptor domain-containing protein [Alicyclobacillus fastidiosus]|uniref:Toll/interleukin-1 receptor domain-containing protein n=1 Tax=Alicyclobacillus fastidiosus TaxID=392011 RepID=A0ABV5AKZ4_9BACL
MAFFTESELITKGSQLSKSLNESASKILMTDSIKKFAQEKKYDIFLSHSYQDHNLILGLKAEIEEITGLSVFVDWIAKPELDRENVTKETADALRQAMRDAKCLLYVATDNSTNSKWMQWELGYFDALKHKVAVIPTPKTDPGTNLYQGTEFVGLYYYVTKELNRAGDLCLWINDGKPSKYVRLNYWFDPEQEPYDHDD